MSEQSLWCTTGANLQGQQPVTEDQEKGALRCSSPSAFYGFETWTTKRNVVKRLEVFHNRCLRESL